MKLTQVQSHLCVCAYDREYGSEGMSPAVAMIFFVWKWPFDIIARHSYGRKYIYKCTQYVSSCTLYSAFLFSFCSGYMYNREKKRYVVNNECISRWEWDEMAISSMLNDDAGNKSLSREKKSSIIAMSYNRLKTSLGWMWYGVISWIALDWRYHLLISSLECNNNATSLYEIFE